jgi:N-acetylmuramoyl-L-alanine amidase
MFAAGLRLALVVVLVPAALSAAEPPPIAHAVPTRPGATITNPGAAAVGKPASLPVTRLGGLEYFSLRDVAALLGLKTSWVEATRKLTLTDATNRLEVTGGSREITLNGLRMLLGSPIVLTHGTVYISKTDLERCLAPVLRPALLGPLFPRPRVIVLDPGHGGSDHGMENKPLHLQEKVLTLDVALRLKKLLETRGYRVVLTRTDDRMLGPDKQTDFITRWDIANRAKADLFVSIHFNSLFPDTKTSGTEVYTFTRAGQRSDPSWSLGGKDDAEPKPSEVNRFDPWSSVLANALHREVLDTLKTVDRGQKTMHLIVLRGLKCPAVLVESVFLSNDSEARRAATPAYLQQIAEGLARGVDVYAGTLEKISPKPAAPPTVSSSSTKP